MAGSNRKYKMPLEGLKQDDFREGPGPDGKDHPMYPMLVSRFPNGVFEREVAMKGADGKALRDAENNIIPERDENGAIKTEKMAYVTFELDTRDPRLADRESTNLHSRKEMVTDAQGKRTPRKDANGKDVWTNAVPVKAEHVQKMFEAAGENRVQIPNPNHPEKQPREVYAVKYPVYLTNQGAQVAYNHVKPSDLPVPTADVLREQASRVQANRAEADKAREGQAQQATQAQAPQAAQNQTSWEPQL